MDEDYLVGLQKQAKQEELQIRKLQEYKEKLQKIINDLRNKKEEAKRDSKIFIKEQLEDITKEIKVAREYAEKEIERSMDKIKQINDIAQTLKEEGDVIDKKRVQIHVDMISLEKDKRETERNIRKTNKCLEAAKESVAEASTRESKAKREEKLTANLLVYTEDILSDVEDYRKNILQKLQEEKDVLEERGKVLDGGYAALGAGLKWVKIEKMKIKDEWISLIKARDYINKMNGG